MKVKNICQYYNRDFFVTTGNELYKNIAGNKNEFLMKDVEDIFCSHQILFIKKTNGDIYAMGSRENNVIEEFNMNITKPTLIPLK